MMVKYKERGRGITNKRYGKTVGIKMEVSQSLQMISERKEAVIYGTTFDKMSDSVGSCPLLPFADRV